MQGHIQIIFLKISWFRPHGPKHKPDTSSGAKANKTETSFNTEGKNELCSMTVFFMGNLRFF